MRTMHSNELVELNVGGTRYMTTVKTLLGPAAQGSMLARTVELHAEYQAPDPLQFTASGVSSDPKPNSLNKGAAAAGAGSSNMWGIAPCLKDKAGALFIDRDGPLFRFVLAYLRMGDKFIPPDDLLTAQQLLLEADYYQLQGLISIMQLHVSKLRKVGFCLGAEGCLPLALNRPRSIVQASKFSIFAVIASQLNAGSAYCLCSRGGSTNAWA